MSPRGATTSRSGSRFYTWGRGERYWSVTTILGALPKDALKWWAARMVAEFAFDRSRTWFTMSREEAVEWLKREPLRYTAGRADLGTAIHRAIDAYATGRPLPGDFVDEEREAVGHFLDFVEVLKPRWVMSEAQVYNRTQRYAGTLDAIVEIELDLLVALAHGNRDLIPWEPRKGRSTVTLLLDTKTGGSVEEGKGVYPEVALQLAAYGRAEFVGAPNGMELDLPALDGAAVLHVNRSGWRLVPVDALRPEVFQAFLFVREVFRWREVLSKEVLGTPLEPVRELLATAGPVEADPLEDETAPPPTTAREG